MGQREQHWSVKVNSLVRGTYLPRYLTYFTCVSDEILACKYLVPKDFPYPFNLFYPTVPPAPIKPSLAHACLKSVPLHADTALKQIEYLRPIFEWHSTLDYLKKPPAGYLSEGVDVLGELDKMAANLRGKGAKKYKKEFDFLADLYTLTSVRVRDFHFSYNTLLLDLFTFQMGVEFVSISKDGFASPEIFLRCKS